MLFFFPLHKDQFFITNIRNLKLLSCYLLCEVSQGFLVSAGISHPLFSEFPQVLGKCEGTWRKSWPKTFACRRKTKEHAKEAKKTKSEEEVQRTTSHNFKACSILIFMLGDYYLTLKSNYMN